MKDKEIIELLRRQLEVSQATNEGLRTAMSEMKQSMEATIEDLRKTIRSLEQSLKDKGDRKSTRLNSSHPK